MTYEEAVKSIPNGYYEHYKGGLFEVVGIAKHSETLEPMVIYKHDDVTWVRPAIMWYDKVKDDQPRFTRCLIPSLYHLLRLIRG